MTLGKRKKFWACFLAVECVFTVCASGYALNTSIFYYFVFGPNKRTNKQTMPDLRLALSSLQCPVQLYHPQQEIELKIPRGQPNASQSKDHSVLPRSPLFCIEDSEKALPEQLKTFEESSLFLSTPACPLLLKACQKVWWDPGQNCWDISNFAPDNNLLYYKNGTKSPPPLPTPCSKLFSPNSVCISCVTRRHSL